MKIKTKMKKSISNIYLNEIEFFPEAKPKILNEYISTNQLIYQYGGCAKIEEYWYLLNRPPNIPNEKFEENINNIMSKEQYKNILRNNEYMIPHPDMALELRTFRKKRGNIQPRELIFKTYKEKRNSYNGIDERIQLDDEFVSQMLNNSGLISENSSVIFQLEELKFLSF